MITIGPNSLSVIVFQRENWWVAQCLEYDIAAQTQELPNLPYEFSRLLIGRMVVSKEIGLDPFEAVPAAPQLYWEMFEHAKMRMVMDKVPFRGPTGMHYPPPIQDLRLAHAPA